MLVKFQKWTKLRSEFLTFCIPKSSSSCQNLISVKPDSLSGVIRSWILSCSSAIGTLNSKLFMRLYGNNLPFCLFLNGRYLWLTYMVVLQQIL